MSGRRFLQDEKYPRRKPKSVSDAPTTVNAPWRPLGAALPSPQRAVGSGTAMPGCPAWPGVSPSGFDRRPQSSTRAGLLFSHTYLCMRTPSQLHLPLRLPLSLRCNRCGGLNRRSESTHREDAHTTSLISPPFARARRLLPRIVQALFAVAVFVLAAAGLYSSFSLQVSASSRAAAVPAQSDPQPVAFDACTMFSAADAAQVLGVPVRPVVNVANSCS